MKKSNVLEVLDLYNSQEQFEIWDIKTSIRNILLNFFTLYNNSKEEIVSFENKLLLSCSTVEEEMKEFKKEIFFLKIGSIVMTPILSRNPEKKFVSKSAIRQYLEVLIAFNVIKPTKDIYYKSNMVTGFF